MEEREQLYLALEKVERNAMEKITANSANVLAQFDTLLNTVIQSTINSSNSLQNYLSNELCEIKTKLLKSNNKPDNTYSYKSDASNTTIPVKRKTSPVKFNSKSSKENSLNTTLPVKRKSSPVKVSSPSFKGDLLNTTVPVKRKNSPVKLQTKNVVSDHTMLQHNYTTGNRNGSGLSISNQIKAPLAPYVSNSSNIDHESPPIIAQKLYSCEICQYSSHEKENLNNHIKVLHKIKGFKCDDCDKSFLKQSSLKRHMHVHKTSEKANIPPRYIINQILDKRVTRGQIEYLVSWVGYGLEESTWEPKSSLEKASPLLVQQVEMAQMICKYPGEKYCICNGIDNGSPMIQCDYCMEWFHYSCLNLNANSAELEEIWKCVKCKIVKNMNNDNSNTPLNLHNTTY